MKEVNKFSIVMIFFLISGLILEFGFEIDLKLDLTILATLVIATMFGWYGKSSQVEKYAEDEERE